MISLVLDGQVMKRQTNEDQQQRSQDHQRNGYRLLTSQSGNTEERDRRAEENQPKGRVLRVRVGWRDHCSFRSKQQKLIVGGLAVQVVVMNEHTETQDEGLPFLDDDSTWLSLRERLPPEWIRHQQPVVSGMKP